MKASNLLLLSGGLDSVVLAHDLVVRYGRENVRGIHYRLSDELGEMGFRSSTATASRLDIGLDVVELASLVGVRNSHGNSMRLPEFDTEFDVKNESQPGTPTVMPAVVAASIFYCQMLGIPSLSLGLIGNQAEKNPDLVLSVAGLTAVVKQMNPKGVGGVTINTPLISMDKADVIRRGAELGVPLGETWSCLEPTAKIHCGVCAQCVERRQSFEVAKVPDTTIYTFDCKPWVPSR